MQKETTMPRKPTSKRLARAHAEFRTAITDYLLSNGAVADGRFYDYCIDTPAGPLAISVWDTSIMTRFDDVERGKLFTASCGCSSNPYSGKWNFHFSDHPDSLEPAAVLRHFGFFFDQLLAWKPAVAC
jgi:hypothetical protein